MNGLSLLTTMALALASALSRAEKAAPDLTAPIPPGETALTEIGLYRVWWQSYGREPVAMPLSWMGHFDEATGVSYKPWGRVLEREGLLLHSPWRVPPGKIWVDYQLALPRTIPIHLSFGVAMGADVAMPDKSDGSTFSCYLLTDAGQRELLRQHYNQAFWRDYDFDLSDQSGKTITLRLQVEPGPKNNASFDYSFFGDAKIEVGVSNTTRADSLRKFTATKAYQATAKASLLALSNTARQGVTPSTLLPRKNSLRQSGDAWVFSSTGADGELVYTWKPTTGTLDDFTAQVDQTPAFQPALGGGVTAVLPGKDKPQTLPRRGGKALKVSRQDHTLRVLWEYPATNHHVRVDWEFTLVGKSLVISARCDDPVISTFTLGEAAVPLRKTFNVPYLAGQVHFLPVQGVFACRYLDWTQSHASQCPQGEAAYEPKTDGTRNPLHETGYIAVSQDLGEVLPNLPHPPSPYLAALGPNVMLDIWGHHQGTYAGDAAQLRELKDLGVDHLVIIQHNWQRFGYDVKLPDHLPANPRYGGDDGMKLFGQTARDCGYLWSLHENYIDLYPDAPSYDPASRVLHNDGSPSKAWFNEGTKVQSWGLKCNHALGYAQQNSPEAHARYGTTAAYLDVHTCVPPWHQLDHEAGQPLTAMALAKVRHDAELFQFERDTHRGPLFGEGANHFYWAGLCDGVEAQVAGGEDHMPLLDFDLLKLHPQMVNHGMGYYERWFRQGYNAQWGVNAGSLEQLDHYRAMELAYGHAGFLGGSLVHHPPSVVREHHLMHPVQRLYGTAKPVEIRYEVDGQFVTAGAALIAAATERQRIRYDSGLTLWVNGRKQEWKISPKSEVRSPKADAASLRRIGDFGLRTSDFALPQWGWLAVGPDTLAGTFLLGGNFADYAECPEYVFADARTVVDQPWVVPRKNIEPRLRSLEHLGGDRIRVTYEWRVNDTLDADYHCFVHFLDPARSSGEGIVFQQDHALPKATSQWRPGDVIVDGPYEVRVPATQSSYDLVIGLFKDKRVLLQGPDDGGTRIHIARIKLEQSDGQITLISSAPAALATAHRPSTPAIDFSARRNPPGTTLDFGKLATDGSVKINLSANRLVILPYPRDRQFKLSLDLKALAPSATPSSLKVRALAASTQQDLGPAEFKVESGRLLLTAGQPGVGRWVVTW